MSKCLGSKPSCFLIAKTPNKELEILFTLSNASLRSHISEMDLASLKGCQRYQEKTSSIDLERILRLISCMQYVVILCILKLNNCEGMGYFKPHWLGMRLMSDAHSTAHMASTTLEITAWPLHLLSGQPPRT